MNLRKISANLLFTGEGAFIANGIIYLDSENKILKIKDPGRNPAEEAGVEFYNGIITPGFINTHCHIELSHFFSKIPEKTGLDLFIRNILSQRNAEPEIIQKAIEKADLEMRREGIVAVGDVCNTRDSFLIKAGSKIYYHNFIEIFGLDGKKAGSIFEEGKKLLNDAIKNYGLSASLVPHSSYSVSKELFNLLKIRRNNFENLLSIHNQEYDMDYSRKAMLKLFNEDKEDTSDYIGDLSYLSKMIPHIPPCILVHNVLTKNTDIEKSSLDMDKTFFSLCPNSNLYISGVLPENFLMTSYPDKVCLGTDSLASNHRLSLLEEMKTLQNSFDLPLEILLQFACKNGAKALQINNIYGEFRKGTKPGVNLIEKADLHNKKLRPESKIKVLV
jgi:cytosine/adenosine deaminase-related metal-dependent hydrolase